ncbi:MAG: SGNH/GDSL hydrolase family protein [Microscillaceae bacterium]|nr:SGNH/GDSL hydrolase family protein [Microscillaceae bacterium]
MKEIRPFLEIIAICLFSLLALSYYAAIDQHIEFGVKVKKSALRDYVTMPPAAPLWHEMQARLVGPLADSALLVFETRTNVLDSSSHRILLTGDSMCEGLMFRFKKYAEQNHHELKTVIWYSSTTEKWSKSDSLRKLVASYKPDYIFFTTGSNELFIRNIEDREPYIQDIVRQAGTCKFIWIGPPNWAEDTGINNLIIKNVGRDRFFESRRLKFERGPDGAHPTWSSAAIWADTISNWIMTQSRHKILMRIPLEKNKTITAKSS